MAYIMFNGFSARSRKWLHNNYVITVNFICNRFSMEMFHCRISNYNCARSFLCRTLGLICLVSSSLSDFLSSWSRAFFSSLLLELLIWVWSQVLLFNWLILSFLWLVSFFSLAITVRWLLPAVDICILFLVWSSV